MQKHAFRTLSTPKKRPKQAGFIVKIEKRHKKGELLFCDYKIMM
jgi:hypothetical protein